MFMKNLDLTKYFPDVSFCPGVQVCGIKSISIGAGTCIGQDAWLNICVQDEEKRMKIGKSVLVGRRTMISTGGHLEIGDFTIMGPNVYIGDVDHDYTDNLKVPILCGGITDNRAVTIEENCWMATNSVVSGNLTLGRGSVVGANSVLTKDIPPFSVVVGNPAKIVRMYDTVTNSWNPIRSQEDIEQVLENRKKTGIPSRQEYRKTLSSAGLGNIPQFVGGGEIHIY